MSQHVSRPWSVYWGQRPRKFYHKSVESFCGVLSIFIYLFIYLFILFIYLFLFFVYLFIYIWAQIVYCSAQGYTITMAWVYKY